MSYVSPALRSRFESLFIDLKNEILSRNVTLNSLQDLMAVLQQIVEEGEAAPYPGRCFAATVYSMRQSVNDPGPPDRAGLQPVLAHSYALPSGC